MSWRRSRRSDRFGRYVPVGARLAAAEAFAARRGGTPQPVDIDGRTIARSFWGRAWCDHMESYSDYASRLPRGRTYVRNGSVVDLRIEAGRVAAVVAGTEPYTVSLTIEPLGEQRWAALRGECAGQVDSLVSLLQGTLSPAVMGVVTRRKGGLLPAPREITMGCSCPDWADMCKHLAATLYGVGARLDHSPELLFTLRGVDPADLLDEAISAGTAVTAAPTGRALLDDDLSSLFGVDIAFDDEPVAPSPPAVAPVVPSAERTVGRRSQSTAPSPIDPPALPIEPAAARRSSKSPTLPPPVDLDPTELRVLTVRVIKLLGRTPGLGVAGIAQKLELPPGVARAAVDKLCRDRMIRPTAPGEDGGYERILGWQG